MARLLAQRGMVTVRLTVHRFLFSDKSTIGSLDVDGVFQCYTLEPATPIPCGVYPLRLRESPKFQRVVPHVDDVPGHTEIEIHIGNYPKDTHLCTLVGKSKGTDAVWESEQAFNELMGKLDGQTDMTIEDLEERAISAGSHDQLAY